jgi:hypothetical protein
VLHKYFNHGNYASFQRQLNYFHFKKVSGLTRMAPCVYLNPLLTDDIRSLATLKRKTNGVAKRRREEQEQEQERLVTRGPDFGDFSNEKTDRRERAGSRGDSRPRRDRSASASSAARDRSMSGSAARERSVSESAARNRERSGSLQQQLRESNPAAPQGQPATVHVPMCSVSRGEVKRYGALRNYCMLYHDRRGVQMKFGEEWFQRKEREREKRNAVIDEGACRKGSSIS